MTVIIPSRTASNLLPCLQAVRTRESTANVIVVDDGLTVFPGPEDDSISVIKGVKPFVYACNINLGIKAAGDDDVVLLNDDALLSTCHGFSALWLAHQRYPEYGLIASTCNNVGNTSQWPQHKSLREEPRMVCFVAVYIPRSTIEKVGLLDERFTGYGSEDDDYCRRVREAGLKIGIHDGCYVDHGSLRSTFRGHPQSPADIRPNKLIYRQKWGDLN